jgi:hypothetical protein
MYVFTKEISTDKHMVERIVYLDSVLDDEQKQQAIHVESIPDPQQIEGKIPHLYYRPSTNEFYYEYVDRPLTQEEQIQQLINANAELTYKLMMKGVL